MHPDPPKQLETIKIKNPIRFNKPSPPNIPTSIRTHPNLPNRCNHVKYAQINKTYQIQQNLCKSTRIVLNPAETTNIYPNKPNPTQSSNCNEIHSHTCRSTYTERIDHRITRLPAFANYTNNYRSRKIASN